jgi:hypothetical protein
MRRVLVGGLVFMIILFIYFSWYHLFVVILLLDVLGLLIIQRAGRRNIDFFMLFLVLLVLRNVLGIVLLVGRIRKRGGDIIRVFL